MRQSTAFWAIALTTVGFGTVSTSKAQTLPAPKPVASPTQPQTPQTTAAVTGPADVSHEKPPASGGAPTITDAAELSAPGWLEFDPGVLKDLVGDPNMGTPLTFKFTTLNKHLQYLIANDGLLTQPGATGIGDTYFGLHYLFATQDKGGYDKALKGILKVPTASTTVGGTGKADYSTFLLVSRDVKKWGLHEDMNVGLSSIGNGGDTGYSTQWLASYALTAPIVGGRWQYTGELVFLSALPGQDQRVTSMHGLAYARHSYEIYSAAIQMRLQGDIPKYQLLFAASFNLTQF